MLATNAKVKMLASADGGVLTGFFFWLIRDVLISDEATLTAALFGGCLGLWFTSGEIWSKTVKPVEGMSRGGWVLKASISIGMLLSLIVIGSAWMVQFVPNVPLVGSLSVGVPKPALAGMLALVTIVLFPLLWSPAIAAARRFLESKWRS